MYVPELYERVDVAADREVDVAAERDVAVGVEVRGVPVAAVRVVVALAVRVVADVARDEAEEERVFTALLSLLRVAFVVVLPEVAVLLRDEAEDVRMLLLPNDREALLSADVVRAEVLSFAVRVVPCAVERVALRRSASKTRALLPPREAFRVENERSGWRAA